MSRTALVSLAVLMAIGSAAAQVPASYPADYAKTIEAAGREGKLVIYSNTDSGSAGPVLGDFAAMFPQVRVEYVHINSTPLYDRFRAELAAKADTADLIWASSMDGQVKLAAEGHAATYASPELPALPQWAVWQNQAYGTTYEPIAFVYNKRLVPAADVPHDHSELLALLKGKGAAYKGRITAYDPERVVTGYLLANEDVRNFPQAWDLFGAFGKNAVALRSTADDMMESVIEGEQSIGYGIFASYAHARAERVEELGIVIPRDYVLIMSRVALITANARRPNAAKLFLDYLLSQRGQDVLANRSSLFAIRNDVAGEMTARAVADQIGEKARPIAIGPSLLTALTPEHRREFVEKWRAAMKAQ
jgi:iron(III) transport system substrate-binding protein